MSARDFGVIVAISVLAEVAALGIGIWRGAARHQAQAEGAGAVDKHRYDVKVDLHSNSEIDQATREFIARRGEKAATEELAREAFDEIGMSKLPPEVKPVGFDECKTPEAAEAKLNALSNELSKRVGDARQLREHPEAGLAKLLTSVSSWIKPRPGESFYLWDLQKAEIPFAWVPSPVGSNGGFWVTADAIEPDPAGGKPPPTTELVIPLDNPPAALKASFKCHLATPAQLAAMRAAKIPAIKNPDDKPGAYRWVIDSPPP